MTEWIENAPERCRFAWLRRRDHEGDHWAGCDLPAGHDDRHVSGDSYVVVGFENRLTHRWLPVEEEETS